ncbi:hypothetical protein SCOCK_40181 [Actinacidiphila cocklensis]|uniref:Uncharacterized protein n=1 Tax=Actinacidiphila cocklensis TaxID=887465 RepID=A0A9W4DUN8_9ACTN|nr:hypothetical protein SCOCK_40181 [Actinacidiphila cocklensis]
MPIWVLRCSCIASRSDASLVRSAAVACIRGCAIVPPQVPGAPPGLVHQLSVRRPLCASSSRHKPGIGGAREGNAEEDPQRLLGVLFEVSEGGLEPPRPIKGTSTSS